MHSVYNCIAKIVLAGLFSKYLASIFCIFAHKMTTQEDQIHLLVFLIILSSKSILKCIRLAKNIATKPVFVETINEIIVSLSMFASF